MFKGRIEAKGMESIFEMSNCCETVLFDEDRLKQILINLVGNAIKFSEKGYVKVCLETIESEKGSGYRDISFFVEDTGIGIPKKHQKIIFGSFEQVYGENQEKYGGTGLGLAITKRIVDAMGGEIALVSEPGKGSRFTVKIKNLAVVPVSDSLVETSDSGFVVSRVEDGKKVILSVDDLEMNRRLVNAYLEGLDYIVIEAANGKDAVTMAQKYKPDLILMDLKMPVMDGLEAADVIKNDPALTAIPIVIVSASGMNVTYETIRDRGYSFLLKPFGKDELIRRINGFFPGLVDGGEYPVSRSVSGLNDGQDDLNNIKGKEALLVILEEKFLPEWEEIHDKLFMDSIEKWAGDLKKSVDPFGYNALNDWCDMLLLQIEMFDVENLPFTLKAFPSFVDDLQLCKTDSKGEFDDR
jgi:CheY-like chemotaxis protein